MGFSSSFSRQMSCEPTRLRAEMKTQRGDIPIAAVVLEKLNYLGTHAIFKGSQMNVLVAVCRVICCLQRLVLSGCQKAKDLLVRGGMVFFIFCGTGCLRRG